MKSIMKKLVVLMLAICMIATVALVACDKKSTSTTDTEVTDTTGGTTNGGTTNGGTTNGGNGGAQNGSLTFNAADAADYINGNTAIVAFTATAGADSLSIELGATGWTDKIIISFGEAIDVSSATTFTFYASGLDGISIKAVGSDATAGWDNKGWPAESAQPWINKGAANGSYYAYTLDIATVSAAVQGNGGSAVTSIGSLIIGGTATASTVVISTTYAIA